ncbi:DUF4222 domain-containing protein [Erwinia tracheiphila]|uniref:DUF4222 domain-containing protein n=1 Tax=Erwinia tracheiphila TaxID=65700 RepID=A0A345CUQ4_9GAMM|nr:DUF4222 domain-containing protein [Erwinia tracheiphila]AXF77171.1 DUF4222 domain-containing protein [Erwinia tracheiphila]UIA84138.1 DUF4222 domain-containing protein [Erwinia tracheiphila]UIA92720.1 DUF4222 domain-containing protein [Erwinia tracheiphila]
MKNKNSGLTASGQTHPKNDNSVVTPYPGQCWKDNRGHNVTVAGASIHRVKFIRDGYSSPCEVPTARFLKEFTLFHGGEHA